LVAFAFAFVFPWFVWFLPSILEGLKFSFSWGFIKICDDNRMGAAIALVFLCFLCFLVILIILIILFILFFNVFVLFHIFFHGD